MRQMNRVTPGITGVDISEERIRIAKELWPSGNFECADALQYLERDEIYDCITIFDGLEHFEPKSQSILLNSMVEHLDKDGGRIFINYPNRRFIEDFRLRGKKTQLIDEPPYFSDLVNTMEALGMDLIFMQMYGVEADYQYIFCVFERALKQWRVQ